MGQWKVRIHAYTRGSHASNSLEVDHTEYEPFIGWFVAMAYHEHHEASASAFAISSHHKPALDIINHHSEP